MEDLGWVEKEGGGGRERGKREVGGEGGEREEREREEQASLSEEKGKNSRQIYGWST